MSTDEGVPQGGRVPMIAASTATHLADGYLPARQRSYDKFEQEEETDVEQDWPAETGRVEETAGVSGDTSSLDDIESKKGGGGQGLGSSGSFPGLSHADDHHDGISRGGPWGRVESLKAVRAEDSGLSAMEVAEAAEGLETEVWTRENSDGKIAGQGVDWQKEEVGARSDALLQTETKSSDDESLGPETFDASSIRANNDRHRHPAEVMKVLEARYGDERSGERWVESVNNAKSVRSHRQQHKPSSQPPSSLPTRVPRSRRARHMRQGPRRGAGGAPPRREGDDVTLYRSYRHQRAAHAVLRARVRVRQTVGVAVRRRREPHLEPVASFNTGKSEI